MSFKTITKFLFNAATLFKASKASPPVSAPSPITATTLSSLPFNLFAVAIPNAAEIDVELCPVSNESASLSFLFGNPLNPSKHLNVVKSSFLPVRILCVYA